MRAPGIQLTARDHARTPMQWDSSPQAGFSTAASTWMRVMDSFVDINVASQVSSPPFFFPKIRPSTDPRCY